MEAVPLIHNPASGGGRGARVAQKAADMMAARGIPTTPVATKAPLDAIDLAQRLAQEGHERIFAIGGDGTLSETCDGVLRSGRSPTLGLLPGGTGNSLLRAFGLETLEPAVEAIAAGKASPMDAARVRWGEPTMPQERHFVNVFGTGFVARVCDLANRRYKWMGHSGYTWAVFPQLTRLRCPHTKLTLDGRIIEDQFALVSVCNTEHTGGAMRIAPMAKPDDGWLDVIALREVSRAGLLKIFPKIFDGEHVGHERVLIERAKTIRIEPEEESPLLGDGEVYGATPCEIQVLPGALQILRPR